MKSTMLFLRMALRRRTACLLAMAFTLVATVFLQVYPQFMENVRTELEYAYDTIEVSGWLINAEGYEDPLIPGEVWHTTVETGYLSEYSVYSCVSAILPSNIGSGYDEMEQELHRQMKADPDRIVWKQICGISSFDAQDEIRRQMEEIQWAEGYSASSFISSTDSVCILPESEGVAPGEHIPVMFKAVFPYPGAAEYCVEELYVAGTYPRSTGVDTTAYCPVDMIERMAQAQNWRFYVNNFVFTIEDNRDLPALKEGFREMGLGIDGETGIRAAIDDRILDGTVAPIQGNLGMLEGLYRFFFVVVAVLGFFICYLQARSRKAEYAVMRLLGEGTGQVTRKALLEQLALCVCGIVPGTALVLLTGLGSPDLTVCGIILLCYTLGAAAAVLLTVRVNVMEILRDKE